jgi:hypothetical protein
MAMTSRERYISLAVLVAAGLFVVDRLILSPYLERRRTLADEMTQRDQSLNEAQQVLGRERQLRLIIKGMGASLRSDSSTVEGQLLHLLYDWQQQAGVAGASFQRVHAIEAHGFTHLKYQISAGGSMPAIAMLVYRVETAPIPLRVDDLHVTPKKEGGDDLQVQLVISTLGRTGLTPVDRTPTPGVALLQGTGGLP